MMRLPSFTATHMRLLVAIALGCTLAACADLPHRPYVASDGASVNCPESKSAGPPEQTTPEVPADGAYTLHYLEFDDQGWSYPDGKNPEKSLDTNPGRQVDCAIASLTRKLEQGNVRAFVFVHGWHHSAKHDDRDLNRFRDLLREHSADRGRQVVGFYVGWKGGSIEVPYVRDLSFWGRKNAAHHVAEGRVREFFARMKALRNGWNRPKWERSKNCGKPEAQAEGKGCPLRTVMIGHSFGAWILFAATSPYIMETLAGSADLPKGAKTPVTARERGIADLVLLLNPAFEASRYEPLHRAAQRYVPTKFETPLLVSVTSTADGATRYAFPVARFFNSIFQYPAASDSESVAMRNTHGHLTSYLTHRLEFDPDRKHEADKPDTACLDENRNASDLNKMRAAFFNSAAYQGELDLKPGWKRQMCGGLTLTHLRDSELGPYSVVWNVQTFDKVIPGHNAITEMPLRDFGKQIYADISRAPRMKLRNHVLEPSVEDD